MDDIQSLRTNNSNLNKETRGKQTRDKHEENVCVAAARILERIRNKEYELEERPDKIERKKKAVDCTFRCGDVNQHPKAATYRHLKSGHLR